MDGEQFDLQAITEAASLKNRYERQVADMEQRGLQTSSVRVAVEGALSNIAGGGRSFVIYGDPQSGKTEMMICLTAKLLDDGHKIVVHLMNDSVDLLAQNLDRFSNSGLAPAPLRSVDAIKKRSFDREVIIFCKKNGRNLSALLQAIDDAKVDGQNVGPIVVIDDEADFASPNSKINKNDRTPINDYVNGLVGDDGIYVGVTATPARLNLNRTLDNEPKNWVRFPTHDLYTGQDTFFPEKLESAVRYRRVFLKNGGDVREARSAIIRFLVTVAHLNTTEKKPDNYSMLFHTSGKTAQHEVDTATIERVILDLRDQGGQAFQDLAKEAFDDATLLYPKDSATTLAKYVVANVAKSKLIVLNSTTDRNSLVGNATKPSSPFTFYVGGNIVSRGVTFDNLLAMFFTRDVRQKLQQDTYIQRARMFGTRGKYLEHFELTIPRALYHDWQRCFVFHRLSLNSIEKKVGTPAWVGDRRIAVAAPSSIDRATVSIEKGEMSYAMFDWDPGLDELAAAGPRSIATLRAIQGKVGEDALPSYLIDYLEKDDGTERLLIHTSYLLGKIASADKMQIKRKRGFLGDSQLQLGKFPKALYHVRAIRNDESKARVFFKIRDATFTHSDGI